MTKICRRCGSDGPFNLEKRSKDGLTTFCKECLRKYGAQYRKDHSDELRTYSDIWRANNPERLKEYARSNYARNKEQARADRRAYYAQNKDRMNARVRKNYETNRMARLEQIQEWKNANPNKVREMSNQRRGWKAGAAGSSSEEQISARVEVFGGMCAYCGERPYEHIDHTIALSRGGTNWPANLRPACAKCNLSKNARVWPLVSFGGEVGGDCVLTPFMKSLLSLPRQKRLVRSAFVCMEDREILYRDYREAIGATTALERFLILARRYEREEVLRETQLCDVCDSVLTRGFNERDAVYYYCANLCNEPFAESA